MIHELRRGLTLKAMFFAVATMVAGFAYLFSPRPEVIGGIKYVVLYDQAGFIFNTDSMTFIDASVYPHKIAEPKFVYQARPVYMLIPKVIEPLFKPLGWLFSGRKSPMSVAGIVSTEGTKTHSEWLTSENVSMYCAYITLNAFLLLLSLIVFDRNLSSSTAPSWMSAFLACLILVSRPVKGFYWSAHTQMLTFLEPLLCVYAFRAVQAVGFSLKRSLWWGLATGLLILTYGSFVLLIPAITAAVFLYCARQERMHLLGYGCVTVVPILGWMAWIVWLNGSFYSHEVAQYRQFVWVIDAINKGGIGRLIIDISANWQIFASNAVREIGFYCIAACAGMAVMISQRKALKQDDPLLWATFIGSVWVLLLNSMFFYGLGYYEPRLSWNLMTPLLLICALSLNFVSKTWHVLPRRLMSAGVGIFVLSALVLYVKRVGPFM